MSNFTENIIEAVWQKAEAVYGINELRYRKDIGGAWLQKDQYEKEGKYGWGIDHICPRSKGGNENISNLQAMHWENNKEKSNYYPWFSISISSNGKANIYEAKKIRLKKAVIEKLNHTNQK